MLLYIIIRANTFNYNNYYIESNLKRITCKYVLIILYDECCCAYIYILNISFTCNRLSMLFPFCLSLIMQKKKYMSLVYTHDPLYNLLE